MQIPGGGGREANARSHDDYDNVIGLTHMGAAADDLREPVALSRLRAILLWTLLFGAAGMMGELLLIGHAESAAQFVPLVLLAIGVLAGIVLLVAPTRAGLRLLQGLMILFLGSGILGVGLHYQGNTEFELEMHPSISGLELLSKTLTGATPVLAPGSMSLLGVIGLASTYRHPLLRSALESEETSS